MSTTAAEIPSLRYPSHLLPTPMLSLSWGQRPSPGFIPKPKPLPRRGLGTM
ncbi:hypothetical protein RHMOL_Rhmol04G0215900 [Rhododendron molle]|uniref:Uncharacterized protein n=1 Tax=Rhododendron molle TaxID=49168 RepID=A0ACC0P365_RHOML|nr:hypothetical protein RHMOL_Rhmol04G0215900 [Rhododendron molle]